LGRALLGLVAALAAASPPWVLAQSNALSRLERVKGTPATARLDEVSAYLLQGNCAQAVRQLNLGLEEKSPAAVWYTGVLFDRGVCLKRDWSRAEGLFLRAAQAGVLEAAEQLVSGYASPLVANQPALALWWANRIGYFPSGSCHVPAETLLDNQRMAAHIAAMPAPDLADCAWLAGFTAAYGGEMYYPTDAAFAGIEGEFNVGYAVATGEVQVQMLRSNDIRSVGETGQRRRAQAEQALSTVLQAAARRAHERMPRRAGLPDTRLLWNVTFRLLRPDAKFLESPAPLGSPEQRTPRVP
jgi:hypothetical protein